MAEDRNVVPEGSSPGEVGGQGRRALSVPMRVEAPAARITPHTLDALTMQ